MPFTAKELMLKKLLKAYSQAFIMVSHMSAITVA
jgi:hypothetical protein